MTKENNNPCEYKNQEGRSPHINKKISDFQYTISLVFLVFLLIAYYHGSFFGITIEYRYFVLGIVGNFAYVMYIFFTNFAERRRRQQPPIVGYTDVQFETHTDFPQINDPADQALLDQFHALSTADQSRVLTFIDALAKTSMR